MMLGKRKRDTKVVSRRKIHVEDQEEETSKPVANTNDVFRQYFEAQFAPLPEQHDTTSDSIGDDESEEEDIVFEEEEQDDDSDSATSEWSGISETFKPEPVAVIEVKVVDHSLKPTEEEDEFHRARQKAFMSTRPPREIDFDRDPKSKTSQQGQSKEDTLNERLNLKHDLDLQRLLKESHLLERSKTSSTPGKERQKALDMRLQSLGAKDSLFEQRKMPVAHRVGITKKADQKEARRRHEAKENGVILEKVSFTSGSGAGSKKAGAKYKSVKRQRGVDAPGVGRFSGGTLKLSRKDVASIQGPSSGGAARKGRRR